MANTQVKYQGICFACNSIFDLDRPYAIGEIFTCPVCGKQVKVIAIWWIHRVIRFLRLGWLYRLILLSLRWVPISILGATTFWSIANIYVKTVAAIVVLFLGLYSVAWIIGGVVSIITAIFEAMLTTLEIIISLLALITSFTVAVALPFVTLLVPLIVLFGIVYVLLSGPMRAGQQPMNFSSSTQASNASPPIPPTGSSSPRSNVNSPGPVSTQPSPTPPTRRTGVSTGGNNPTTIPSPTPSSGFPSPMGSVPGSILRNQNRTIALLLIMIAIMGMIIVLCFLSHRTGETFQDLSKPLLGYSGVSFFIFFTIISGIKLYGSRRGYQGILTSGRSLATFLIYAIVLGAANAVALIVVDGLVGDLERDYVSKIAMMLYSDLIVSTFIMLFLEKSFQGWRADAAEFINSMRARLLSIRS